MQHWGENMQGEICHLRGLFPTGDWSSLLMTKTTVTFYQRDRCKLLFCEVLHINTHRVMRPKAISYSIGSQWVITYFPWQFVCPGKWLRCIIWVLRFFLSECLLLPPPPPNFTTAVTKAENCPVSKLQPHIESVDHQELKPRMLLDFPVLCSKQWMHSLLILASNFS